MTPIKGRILAGEQIIVIFNKRKNPPVKRRDIIIVDDRKFKVCRLEEAWNFVTAEVVVYPEVKRRIHVNQPSLTLAERYVVRMDLLKVKKEE